MIKGMHQIRKSHCPKVLDNQKFGELSKISFVDLERSPCSRPSSPKEGNGRCCSNSFQYGIPSRIRVIKDFHAY